MERFFPFMLVLAISDLAIKIIPPKRAMMMLQVSKETRKVMEEVPPPAVIKVKADQDPTNVLNAIPQVMKLCKITSIDLSKMKMPTKEQEKLAEVIGKCTFLAGLNLRDNMTGPKGAGKLAAVLGQCASLAHLDLRGNGIGDEGAGRLAAVLGQCASLSHLNLEWNGIGDEGVGRLAAVLGQCASLAHLKLGCNRIAVD